MLAKYKKFIVIITLGFLLLASLPNVVLALNPILDKLEKAGGPTGANYNIGKKDPIDIVANIVQIFLGLLSVIFLILMIYAGYLWMTASGSEDKITKAKHILLNASIGLAIVLSAYALTWFVFEYFHIAGGGVSNGGVDTQS
ncbi:MAG: hypothetical protein V1692_02920 [bacterium]